MMVLVLLFCFALSVYLLPVAKRLRTEREKRIKEDIGNAVPIFFNVIGAHPIDADGILIVIKTTKTILTYYIGTTSINKIQLICTSDNAPERYVLVLNKDVKYLTLYFQNNKQLEFYFDLESKNWIHIEDDYSDESNKSRDLMVDSAICSIH